MQNRYTDTVECPNCRNAIVVINCDVMRKALTFGLYACLFLLTGVTLWTVCSVIWGSSNMSSCREMMLGELDMGWEHLRDALPYSGGRFNDTNLHLKEQKLVEQLPNGGARYTAVWDTGLECTTDTIVYYRDRNGCCLAECLWSLSNYVLARECSHWYTISESGLVVINKYYWLCYGSLAFATFVLPLIAWLYSLYKIIFYLVLFWHTHGHNSH